MGSEFFWFFDIFVTAVAAATIYRGAKKGAVSVLISSVSAIAAFLIAVTTCGIISEKIYDEFVRGKIEDYMTERLGNTVNTEMIAGLGNVDMLKTKQEGVYLGDMDIEYDERGTAILDLSAADMTETGIADADLTGFGIKSDRDWSLVKAGHITLTAPDVKKYGLGSVVLARVISSEISSGSVLRAFTDVGRKLGETASVSLRGLGEDLENGSRDAIYSFVVSIITLAEGTVGDRIMDDIVTPTVMTPLRAIVFCILFSLVMLIMGIIANASKVINKIPIISKVNGAAGAVLGVLEAAVMLLLICVVIRFMISLGGDSLVFINQTTIDKTLIFKHLYAFDPLEALGLAF